MILLQIGLFIFSQFVESSNIFVRFINFSDLFPKSIGIY